MNYLVICILFTISILLQTTIFGYFQVAGAKPDLVLIMVIIYSLYKGPHRGALIGFLAGFLVDITSGTFLGLNAFSKMMTGYLIGYGETNVAKENLIIPLLAVFTGSLLNEFLLYLLHSSYGYESSIIIAFVNGIFPFAFYNTALVPILYNPIQRFILKAF